jgi:hypothetical protein
MVAQYPIRAKAPMLVVDLTQTSPHRMAEDGEWKKGPEALACLHVAGSPSAGPAWLFPAGSMKKPMSASGYERTF